MTIPPFNLPSAQNRSMTLTKTNTVGQTTPHSGSSRGPQTALRLDSNGPPDSRHCCRMRGHGLRHARRRVRGIDERYRVVAKSRTHHIRSVLVPLSIQHVGGGGLVFHGRGAHGRGGVRGVSLPNDAENDSCHSSQVVFPDVLHGISGDDEGNRVVRGGK